MNTGWLPAGRRRNTRPGHLAAMTAALIIYMASAPAFATEVPDTGVSGASASSASVSGASVSGASVSGTSVLEASDHAALTAAIPASGVVRIALVGDRVARVIRAPGGLRVEHDPASGDLYLHPLGQDAAGPADSGAGPAVLFIGTERGFTYRLSLVSAPAGAAQILIRNPEAAESAFTPDRAVDGNDDRIGALVGLIRAVVLREPLPGYAIETGPARSPTGAAVADGPAPFETWRGPRFTALAFELGAAMTHDAETLAARLGPGVAAAWISAPSGAGARLAVAVRERAAGESR